MSLVALPLALVVAVMVADAMVSVARGGVTRATGEQGRAIAGGQRGAPARADGAGRVTAIESLLAGRAHAVLTHSATAFLAGVDRTDPAFYRRQQTLFSSLGHVPFAALRYQLDSATVGSAASRHASRGSWTSVVTMAYRLAGFDATDVTERYSATFVQRGSRWLLASTVGPPTATTGHELWDYGQVVAVRGSSTLVLGFAPDTPLLRMLAAEADRDIARVSAVWGPNWARHAVLEAPATVAQFGAVSGIGGDPSRVEAAQSTEETGSGPDRRQSGNRIVIDPVAFRELSAAGKTAVVTHELTHVASRASTTPQTPLWLVEGLADYVAYRRDGVLRPGGLTDSALTRELRTLFLTSGVPAALPSNSEFDSSNPQGAAAYEQAWLACRLIAQRYGSDQLVRLYRLVAVAADAGAPNPVDSALRSVTGRGLAAFTARWRAYVGEQVR